MKQRVDTTKMTAAELSRYQQSLAAARVRANNHRTAKAARQLITKGQPQPQSFIAALSAEEEQIAAGIIASAVREVAELSDEAALLGLIASQKEEIARAQAEYNMPGWYPAGVPVTLFTLPRYPRTRLSDNDHRRPRIANLIKHQLPAVRGLGDEILTALREYQDGVGWNPGNAQGVYQPVNRCLRGQAEPDYSQWRSPMAKKGVNTIMRLLDAAFSQVVTPENILTYRGIRGHGAFPRKTESHSGNFAREFSSWKIGEIRSDPAYVHTTLSRRVARELFTVGHNPGGEAYVIEYRVPTGTRAISMNAANPNSDYAHTVELLIDRDTQFQVVAKYKEEMDGLMINWGVLDILPPARQAGRRKLPTYK